MGFERLPETIHTLYAELLDQAIRAEAGARLVGLAPGTPVSKTVGGRTYWYMQRMEAGRKRQVYIGPESPALLEWLEEARRQRADWVADEARRGEIVSMLVAGGAVAEAASVARVLRLLADANVFRLGGVLVGTQAFRSYANILGVRFEEGALRTEDVDVAQDPAIAVAVAEDSAPTNVEKALREADPRFFAVPGLDPGKPSTSFKVRGRDLRVDFLTPLRGRPSTEPVPLPLLRVAATPLRFLGYLIRDSLQAVVLGARGVLVNVPQPGRFALHKLWTAGRRPVSEQAKARKDLRQAEALIEVLLGDRADDLNLAWQAAVQEDARAAEAIEKTAPKLRPEVLGPLERQLGWK
jgi:hypothetical protein